MAGLLDFLAQAGPDAANAIRGLFGYGAPQPGSAPPSAPQTDPMNVGANGGAGDTAAVQSVPQSAPQGADPLLQPYDVPPRQVVPQPQKFNGLDEINPQTGLAKPHFWRVAEDVLSGDKTLGQALDYERTRPFQQAAQVAAMRMMPQLYAQAAGYGGAPQGDPSQSQGGTIPSAPQPAPVNGAGVTGAPSTGVPMIAPSAATSQQRRALSMLAIMKGDYTGAAAINKADVAQAADGTMYDKNTGAVLGRLPLPPKYTTDRESGFIYDEATGKANGRFPRASANQAGVYVDPVDQLNQPGVGKDGTVTWQDQQGVWHQGLAPGATGAAAALKGAEAYATKGAEGQFETVTVDTPDGPRTMLKSQLPGYLGGGGKGYNPQAVYGGGPAPTPATAAGPAPWAADPAGFIGSQVGGPVRITSGLRSPQRNAAVGGVPNSAHLQPNTAYDFVPQGMDPNAAAGRLAQSLHQANVPFDQIINEGDHVHVSFDPRARGQVMGVKSVPQTQPAPAPQGGQAPGGSGGVGVVAPTDVARKAAPEEMKADLEESQQARKLANFAHQFVNRMGDEPTGPGYADVHLPVIGDIGSPGEGIINTVGAIPVVGQGAYKRAVAVNDMNTINGQAWQFLKEKGTGPIRGFEAQSSSGWQRAFPNPENWAQTNVDIAGRLEQDALRAEAKVAFKQNWMQAHGGSLQGAEAAWNASGMGRVTPDSPAPGNETKAPTKVPTKRAAGMPQGATRSATGPNGQKLYLVNGQWVGSQ